MASRRFTHTSFDLVLSSQFFEFLRQTLGGTFDGHAFGAGSIIQKQKSEQTCFLPTEIPESY